MHEEYPLTPCDDAPVAELGVDAQLKFQKNPSMKAFPLEQKLLITSSVRKQDIDTEQLWSNPQTLLLTEDWRLSRDTSI